MTASVVVGIGRSGMGAARLLQAQGHTVTVLDSKNDKTQQASAKALRQLGIEVHLSLIHI